MEDQTVLTWLVGITVGITTWIIATLCYTVEIKLHERNNIPILIDGNWYKIELIGEVK